MKKLQLLSVLVLGATMCPCSLCVDAPKDAATEVRAAVEKPVQPLVGGQAAIGPRWTYGIMVKNASDQDIWVGADGSATSYEKIAMGAEKLIRTSTPGPKGIFWRAGDSVYATAQFGKPDYVVIKKGNRYTMTAMDAFKDMGSWTSVAPVKSVNILPTVRALRPGEGYGIWWGPQVAQEQAK